MKKQSSFYFLVVLLSLAAIGIITQFVTDPGQFLKSLIFSALVILAIFFILKKFLLKSSNNKEQRAYRKAARQSAKRYKQTNHKKVAPLNEKTKKRRPASHLTVIDGKKDNKKNRA